MNFMHMGDALKAGKNKRNIMSVLMCNSVVKLINHSVAFHTLLKSLQYT